MLEPFVLSAEFGPVIARYLDQKSSVEDSRGNGPWLPELWPGLVSEIGVAGLTVPDAYGGQGAGLLELGAAVHEAGAHGWSGPVVAVSGVAVALLRVLDPEDSSGLQRDIAEVGRVVVPAFHEDSVGESVASTAVLREGCVTGRRLFVDSGMHATDLLLVAHDGEEPALVMVAADAEGLTVRTQDAVDPGRGVAAASLAGVPAREIARGAAVPRAVRDAWTIGALLIATDAVGAAGRAFELACEYAITRRQFGRTIGSFQAVKHKLVDMYAELEMARSAIREALRLAATAEPGWQTASSAAKSVAGDATTWILREAIHVHGGIGFTWEHELSHHFRRVMACRALYGAPVLHRRLVAADRGLA
ncbi:acyl-CoA dehydrogenase family protein [Mycobacterium sp. IS-3022]|uniref:acyl-CoA dehydrogenase family protein n=1 Tax=Mycobacterium sp. IS-3022 TaxID=1772277 RepID=UPI0007415747|nr:acyl-CoA dehydrogenase family protein [Mycobacterium sp. IS-3022]KUI01814.1 hypothetical protein AU188_17275 [Mycobacterium sp. IS-3022]